MYGCKILTVVIRTPVIQFLGLPNYIPYLLLMNMTQLSCYYDNCLVSVVYAWRKILLNVRRIHTLMHGQ